MKLRLRPTYQSAGFTLIELLVVISIIALLVSILMPALQGARDAARSAMCLSNLRSTGIAMQLYSEDYFEGSKWIPGYYRPRKHVGDLVTGRSVWAGFLIGGHHLSTTSIPSIQCPSWQQDPATYARRADISYGMRLRNMDNVQEVLYDIERESASAIPAGGDSIRVDGTDANGFYLQRFRISRHSSGAVHIRHNDTANILWADCHVAGSSAEELHALPSRHGDFASYIYDLQLNRVY